MTTCRHCGALLQVGVNCASVKSKWCDNPECQNHKKEYRKEQNKASRERSKKYYHVHHRCRSCGDILQVGVNCKAGMARWCNKPECQAKKLEHRRAQEATYRRKRKKYYIRPARYCRCCGDLIIWENEKGKNANMGAKWCNKPKCQAHKKAYNQERSRKWKKGGEDEPQVSWNTNWTKYAVGKCIKCGQEKNINRFKLCYACYKYKHYSYLEGDFLYA